ncbi:MAG: hypothetical protein FJ126_08855 [Deltaproteobacteria bacterium]|nr:hypothetical protein [Deltaproteobacteria bacterium]
MAFTLGRDKTWRLLGLLGILLMGAGWWWGAALSRGPASLPAGETGAPAMTGVRLFSWQDSQRRGSLEIGRIEMVPKRWGIFKLADFKDVQAFDCRVKFEASALDSIFQEMGAVLFHLARSSQPKSPVMKNNPETGDDKPGPPILVAVPPNITAQSFSCEITYPRARVLGVAASVATLAPPQRQLSLSGEVRVTSGPGQRLKADRLIWDVAAERMQVQGPFEFNSGKRRLSGMDGQFSLARGKISPLPAQAKIAAAESSSASPLSLFPFIAPFVKGSKKNALMPFMLLAMGQAQPGGGNDPLPFGNPFESMTPAIPAAPR